MQRNKPSLIAIVGPTATGKTACAVALAKRIAGEVISADSMQVYQGMDIGSAKPTLKERQGVPHHLIDILPPEAPYSAGQFAKQALQAIDMVQKNGHMPILAGGTGFYVHAVLYPLDFAGTPVNHALRAELQALAKEDPQALWQRLEREAPDAAARLHPNDVHRVIRALELAQGGARSGDAFRSMQMRMPTCLFGLTMPRETLYARINARVEAMMQAGLLEETRHVYALAGVTRQSTSMQGLGYRQLLDYIEGRCTLDTAVDRIKMETRRFAKRQLTWFRRQEGIHWLDMTCFADADAAAEAMQDILSKE
nr:tRNA (adenosine(37)-N6)-dimethylallyltransferase MiaA [Maliibacterium massiliense]